MDLFIQRHKFPFIKHTLYKSYQYKHLLCRSINLSETLLQNNTIAIASSNTIHYIEILFASILSNTNLVHLNHTNILSFLENDFIEKIFLEKSYLEDIQKIYTIPTQYKHKLILIERINSIPKSTITLKNNVLTYLYQTFLEKSNSYQIFIIEKQYLHCSIHALQYLNKFHMHLPSIQTTFFPYYNLHGILQIFSILEIGENLENIQNKYIDIQKNTIPPIYCQYNFPIFSKIKKLEKLYSFSLYNTDIKTELVDNTILLHQTKEFYYSREIFGEMLEKYTIPINKSIHISSDKSTFTISPTFSPINLFLKDYFIDYTVILYKPIHSLNLFYIFSKLEKWRNTSYFQKTPVDIHLINTPEIYYHKIPCKSNIAILLNICTNQVLFCYKTHFEKNHSIIYTHFLENIYLEKIRFLPLLQSFSKIKDTQKDTIKDTHKIKGKDIFPMKISNLFYFIYIFLHSIFYKIDDTLSLKNTIKSLPTYEKEMIVLHKKEYKKLLYILKQYDVTFEFFVITLIQCILFKQNKNKQVSIHYNNTSIYSYHNTIFHSLYNNPGLFLPFLAPKNNVKHNIDAYFFQHISPNTAKLYISFQKINTFPINSHYLGTISIIHTQENTIKAYIHGRSIESNILIIEHIANQLKSCITSKYQDNSLDLI